MPGRRHEPHVLVTALLAVLLGATMWTSAWSQVRGQGAEEQLVRGTLVIRNGLLIDVSNWGQSGHDVSDAVVVIRDGDIVASGSAENVEVPANAEIIDAQGGFLVPGLIDGFAALNHQAYANAYLYHGITSILGVESERRGPLDLNSDPAPYVYRLGEIGNHVAPLQELLLQLEELRGAGTDVILLKYQIEPNQIFPLVKRINELGMATIGELGRTTYAEAARCGVDAFVHCSRYSLDLAPYILRRWVAAQPFSDDLDSPKWRYYKMLNELAADSLQTAAHGARMALGGTTLMPTLSLGYLDRPGHRNPWLDPVARILDPRDIHWPADIETGEHHHAPELAEAYRNLALAVLELDRTYFRAGCHYLAGSGTDVWGTMPGISLHHELETLCGIGHTPRQALAAATSNFAETFGWRDIGEIAPGRRADLLILGSDPRQDIANLRDIRAVFQAGRPLDRDRLLQLEQLQNGQLIAMTEMSMPREFLEPSGRIKEEFAYLNRVDMFEIVYISDGLRVKGHLVTPRQPGPYPCVIYNRGGNREFSANTPVRVGRRLARIASWGYTVIASQYRGNAGGEGKEEFGGADVDDVLNLIPLLESLPRLADSERIGMFGFSRGGMMTYIALTRTDRIAAAVVGAGVADSFSGLEARPDMEDNVYAELIPDYRVHRTEVLTARSAILWPERLCKTTPLLLLHGSADWRVQPSESLRMATALYECKHPFRFVFLEGGDHGLTEHSEEVYRLVNDWLDHYVRDRKPWPSLEPHGD